jgi:hypothetical protein
VRTMEWPPRVRNGRLRYVEGVAAAATLILQVVGDLRQNPFNPDGLSLGDITYKAQSSNRPLIESALSRLRPIVSTESIDEQLDEEGEARYVITYVERESKARGEVTVG